MSFQGSNELEKSLYENFSNLNVANSASIERSITESFQKPGITISEKVIVEDEDFVPLTKENLEIHQKRYEFIATNKVNSNNTSKKSQRSRICIKEDLANYLKSPSKNNDEDGSKYVESIKNKTVSISNEENTKNNFREVRMAIIPPVKDVENDSKIETSKEYKFENNESKSESNTPKFIKNNEFLSNINFEEAIIDKTQEKNVYNEKEKNVENEKEKNVDNEKEKISDNEKKNNQFIVKETNNEENNDLFNDLERANFSKNKVNPTPNTAKDSNQKKPSLPLNKNSTSSTARPSNSLTNPDNPPKNHKVLQTKIQMKTKTAKTPQNQYFKNKKISQINKILIYYSSTLFLLRRYNECNKMINHGLQLAEKTSDKLAYANFKRISGSVQYIKKNFQQALKEFIDAEETYKEIGCSLGISISEAAIGFIKYLEGYFFKKNK